MFLAWPVLGDPATEVIPKAREKSRYDGLRANSPFSLATAPAATPPPQASFAANWFVSGIARIGNSDFVTIKSRDLATEFSLFAQETDAKNSVTLVSVEWSDKVGKSTVVIRKGAETAKLEFNEAELRAAPAVAAQAKPAAAMGGAIPGGKAPATPDLSGLPVNVRDSVPLNVPTSGNGPGREAWSAFNGLSPRERGIQLRAAREAEAKAAAAAAGGKPGQPGQ
jgi:hypothetical protein